MATTILFIYGNVAVNASVYRQKKLVLRSCFGGTPLVTLSFIMSNVAGI